MKKLIFASLVFVPAFAFSEGPLFRQKEPSIQQEFENVYQDLRSVSRLKIIQSTFTTTTTVTATTSSSYVNTALSATITPTSTNSKIFVWVSGCLETAIQTNNAQLSLKRGSTEVTGGGLLSVFRPSASATSRSNGSFIWVDSPVTTTATTYTVVLLSADGASNSRFPSNAGETATIFLAEFNIP